MRFHNSDLPLAIPAENSQYPASRQDRWYYYPVKKQCSSRYPAKKNPAIRHPLKGPFLPIFRSTLIYIFYGRKGEDSSVFVPILPVFYKCLNSANS